MPPHCQRSWLVAEAKETPTKAPIQPPRQKLPKSGDMPKFLGARPCVIDFYATWCGPCQRMAPMIEILAQKYGGKVDFYRVDVDKEKELAGDVFGIEAMPTFVYIDKSGAINSTTGAINAKEMISNIEKYCLD